MASTAKPCDGKDHGSTTHGESNRGGRNPIGFQSIVITGSKLVFFEPIQDSVSERLRRWTRNPLGSARRGSNPLAVEFGMAGLLGFVRCAARDAWRVSLIILMV